MCIADLFTQKWPTKQAAWPASMPSSICYAQYTSTFCAEKICVTAPLQHVSNENLKISVGSVWQALADFQFLLFIVASVA